jgi:hypothetical protein
MKKLIRKVSACYDSAVLDFLDHRVRGEATIGETYSSKSLQTRRHSSKYIVHVRAGGATEAAAAPNGERDRHTYEQK